MYYTNCEWYVDMGEHSKPLCERKNLRPAKCSECPVYIKSIEKENAKLRELVAHLMYVKPNDVNAILYKGKLLRFDDLLAEVGMRWESEVD